MGRGDDFTTLMIAEGYSSASRTFRKHISFCLACDSEKHLVDIFLRSFLIILHIYKTWTAKHWQNHSFAIFWLTNNLSPLLWCFPVFVSWRQDFSTEKAIELHPFKGVVVPLCGLSSLKHPESKVWSRYCCPFLAQTEGRLSPFLTSHHEVSAHAVTTTLNMLQTDSE